MRLVGRRVKIVKAEGNFVALGKTGIVISTNTTDYEGRTLVLVRIKGWDQGHSGNRRNGSREYWYFFRQALRLLPRRKVVRP